MTCRLALRGSCTARLVGAGMDFGVRTDRPEPYNALVVDVVALRLEARVIQIMATALQTRQARPFQNGRFFNRGIRRPFLLANVGQEVIRYCDGCRIQARTPIRRVTVRVVRWVAVLVRRDVRRDLSHLFYRCVWHFDRVVISAFTRRFAYGAWNIVPRDVGFCSVTYAEGREASIYNEVRPYSDLFHSINV